VDKWVALPLTAVAGALVAMQAPINSGLGRAVGTFAASTISFAVGTVILALICVTVGGGFGDVGHVRDLHWYYLVGGALGAVYVTTVLVTVRELGAGGVTATTIAGQLTMAVALDRLGILGLPERPLAIPRIIGVLLLAAGVYLIVRD
jgi:bacterial/archaeal transporter family-2 protein